MGFYASYKAVFDAIKSALVYVPAVPAEGEAAVAKEGVKDKAAPGAAPAKADAAAGKDKKEDKKDKKEKK